MNQYLIAETLRQIGLLVELTDSFPQKGFAYLNAANKIEHLKNFNSYVKNQNWEKIPGVGKKISQMISSLFKKGKIDYYESLKRKATDDLFELIQIPGLNPAKVRILYEKLGIENIQDLKKALDENKILSMRLIRPSSLENLRKSVESILIQGPCISYIKASLLADNFINILKKEKLISKIEIAGDLRRKCELIFGIKLIALSSSPKKCFALILQYPGIKKSIVYQGSHLSILLNSGTRLDLFISPPKKFIFNLWMQTGNKEHIDHVLKIAKRKRISLRNLQTAKTENKIYTQIGLQTIPPELRENRGEVEAALKRTIPKLVKFSDLRGAFHCHTIDSDGINTIEELAHEAKKMGWEYLGISDHSKASFQAGGMNEDQLLNQIKKIKKLNAQNPNFYLFSGCEVDVLKNGDLDFSDDILKKLDFVIVSVHRRFRLNKEEMTKRLLRAIENPYTTIIGHLTGRLLRFRDPIEIDVDKIIDACIANNKIIELNGSPARLDMDWRYWIKAKERGLLCSIGPDAHSIRTLSDCKNAVLMARKGWLEKEDVINTMNLKEISSFLKKRK